MSHKIESRGYMLRESILEVKIDRGNEYDYGLFYNEDEALAAADGAWYHLTRHEQRSQAIEVRTDFTEYGYNTIQIYNFNVQELLDKIRGCERDIDDMLGDDEFILDVKQNREMIKSYEIRLKYLGHKLHDQGLIKGFFLCLKAFRSL